jgi:hypothetical protein
MKEQGQLEVSSPTEADEPTPRHVRRGLRFAMLCVVCFSVAAVYAIYTIRHAVGRGEAVSPPASLMTADGPMSLAALREQPYMVFRNTALGKLHGKLGLVRLAAPDGSRMMMTLSCDRVHFAVNRGVCLTAERGVFTTYEAVVFDADFQPRYKLPLNGIPSRVRVSPDGRFAAMTVFVSGHSYDATGFSTLTTIVDVHSGEVVVDDMEKLTVWREGKRFQTVDFNFWGVTFAQDSNRFYATLGAGGRTYLVKGDLATRELWIVRDGIECPSLSPDNTKIAFKKRDTSILGPVIWRLSVLDLVTFNEWPLAETRSVDDQAEWLDSRQILYSLPSDGASAAVTNTWIVQADGSGQPRLLVPEAYSLVVARNGIPTITGRR